MQNRIDRIKEALSVLNPVCLDIIDESFLHKGHNGFIDENAETHLHIKIAADFGSTNMVAKHKRIYQLIKPEFDTGLHAISITIL